MTTKECYICREDISDPIKYCQCNYFVHKKCLEIWRTKIKSNKDKCPICLSTLKLDHLIKYVDVSDKIIHLTQAIWIINIFMFNVPIRSFYHWFNFPTSLIFVVPLIITCIAIICYNIEILYLHATSF